MRICTGIISVFVFANSLMHAAGFDAVANEVKNNTVVEIAKKYPVFPLLKEVKLNKAPVGQQGPLPLVLGFRPPLDIPQARKMILDACEMYLKNLNQTTSLQSSFTQFPVQNNGIEIVGILFDPKVRVPPKDVLWSFALLDGVIQYYVFDREVGKRTVQQETIEEAAIFAGKRQNTAAAQWTPLPGSQYDLSLKEVTHQLDQAITQAKQKSTVSLQLCAKDAAFLPAIILSRMPKEESARVEVLSFTAIPFVSSTVCKAVRNYLVGVSGYVPLLDSQAALAYIREGISLNKNGLMVSRLQWAIESPIYQSVVIAELSKQQDGVK